MGGKPLLGSAGAQQVLGLAEGSIPRHPSGRGIFPNQAMPDSGHVRGDPLTREGDPRVYQEEMGDGPVFWLSAEQAAHTRPLLPKERGGVQVDDRKVLRGIIPVIQKDLRWVDMPRRPMVPTKPSTTAAAAGETRVFSI